MALAGKRQDIGLPALRIWTLDPSEAEPGYAAATVFSYSVLDLRAEPTVFMEVSAVVTVLELVEVVLEEAIERRFLGTALFVDSGHANPYTRSSGKLGIFLEGNLTKSCSRRPQSPFLSCMLFRLEFGYGELREAWGGAAELSRYTDEI